MSDSHQNNEGEEFVRLFGDEEETEGDETDQLIDGIDLENDDDVLDFLGVMLDG